MIVTKFFQGTDQFGNPFRIVKRSDDGYDWFESAVDAFGTKYYKYLFWVKELPIDVKLIEKDSSNAKD